MKPKGGKRAGAGRKSGIHERDRNMLKNLCIEWAIKKMEGKDERLKKEIVLKVIPKVFPQEVGGIDDNPIKHLFEWKQELPKSTTSPGTGLPNSTIVSSAG